ncbi:MAG: NADH-quinone oxidoreductase subunit E [Promethearchaeota archaeon Loki_b31]|nr:MAG: NADH-quinone oxidoreductase subunit E [Candidatus Lokiarchaeota archaeon Loki_b31]
MDETFLDKSIKKHGDFLIPILQDIQENYRYLPEECLIIVAERLQIPLIEVYGVATFYQSFSLIPKGEHIITVCLGTACYIRGGTNMVDVLTKELNIKPGETTKDKKFSLETVNCLGCCAIGPMVLIDGEYYGEMTPQKVIKLIKTLKMEKND